MPDILLSDHVAQRMRTASGNAVAADIISGKTALVNGLKVTGTAVDKKPLTQGNGILLYMQNPVGIGDSAYQPTSEHGAVLVKQSGLTLGSNNNWVLKNNGDAHPTIAHANYVDCYNAPAYSVRRKYEVWGKFINDAIPNGTAIYILFNIQDSNNFWWYRMTRDTSWGGFYSQLIQRTAGVDTVRHDAGGLTSSLDMPCQFHMSVTEQGDGIVANVYGFEIDDFSINYKANFYTVANRPFKASTGFQVMAGPNAGDYVQVQGFRVSDLL